jgi:NADH:ubiquinone oxidoreductase subunit 6 (subunit J)
MALIVIPYFNINVEAEGIFTRRRKLRIQIASAAVIAMLVFLLIFDVYVAIPATVVIGALLLLAAVTDPASAKGFRRWLVSKPISFWIMTWFLMELVTLTAVGTFFRGPGWSWVWPWRI